MKVDKEMIIIERSELIVKLMEKEKQKLIQLTNDNLEGSVKESCGNEVKECEEKLDILEQMLEEIPMDYIKDNKETGLIRQVFVGTIEEKPKLFFDCYNSKNRHYYIKMVIKSFGDERLYKDERLLRLSYKIWREWFFNFKYDEEKEERIKNHLCVYVKAIVIDGEVRDLKWYS